MNQKTLLLFVLLLFLGGVTWWLTGGGGGSNNTIGPKSNLDFAVDQIEEVSKIFITDRSGKEPILLERTSGTTWLLNGAYTPRRSAVDLVLDMVANLQVRNRPTQEAMPTIIESLAADGITVEVYGEKDRLLRKYVIGGVTKDNDANFVIMEGSNEPFVCNIRHFVGNIRGRLEKPGFDDWRDLAIFDLEPDRISSVSVEYPKQRDKSFIIRRESRSSFSVAPYYDLTFKPEVSATNQSVAEAWLEYFDRIPGEAFLNDFQYKDRIQKMIPFAVVTVTTDSGKMREARFFPVMEYDPIDDEFYLIENEAFYRYWVSFDNGDFMLVQMPQVKEIFRSYSTFAKK